MRRLLIIATMTVLLPLAGGVVIAGGHASGTDFCGSDCEYSQAQTLFTGLNNQLHTYPPSPIRTTLLNQAIKAEHLYPPSPISPSSYCASYGALGGLEGTISGFLRSSFPPAPIRSLLVTSDSLVMGIRSASIWTYFPPQPVTPPQTAACIH